MELWSVDRLSVMRSKSKKPNTVSFHRYEKSRRGNSQGQIMDWWFPELEGTEGEGRMRFLCNTIRKKNILDSDRADLCPALEMYSKHCMTHFKMVHFVVCELYFKYLKLFLNSWAQMGKSGSLIKTPWRLSEENSWNKKRKERHNRLDRAPVPRVGFGFVCCCCFVGFLSSLSRDHSSYSLCKIKDTFYTKIVFKEAILLTDHWLSDSGQQHEVSLQQLQRRLSPQPVPSFMVTTASGEAPGPSHVTLQHSKGRSSWVLLVLSRVWLWPCGL